MIGLEYARLQSDMTMKELADQLGISQQLISMWVNGKKKISEQRLTQLQEIFHVNKELLLKEIDIEDKYAILRSIQKSDPTLPSAATNAIYADQMVRMINLLDKIEGNYHQRYQENMTDDMAAEILERINLLAIMTDIITADNTVLQKFKKHLEKFDYK